VFSKATEVDEAQKIWLFQNNVDRSRLGAYIRMGSGFAARLHAGKPRNCNNIIYLI